MPSCIQEHDRIAEGATLTRDRLPGLPIDVTLVARLYHEARAERWRTPRDGFAAALEASAARAFGGRTPGSKELETYLASLHLDDVALACACAAGDEDAWGHFVLEHRPLLYRAADALDAGGGARDLADSLYADLFGLGKGSSDTRPRQSLFRYFHGRSSLTTWLRALLAQRHIDRLRTNRRLAPLPEEDSPAALKVPAHQADPDRIRYLELIRNALAAAVAALAARDRLRLACYYAQELTLAQTGRLLGEHEATVSRQLSRTRRAIRTAVEGQLRDVGLSPAEVTECFAAVTDEPGPLDLGDIFGTSSSDKKSPDDRSIEGGRSREERSPDGSRSL